MRLVRELDVDFAGFVFAPSPRQIDIDRARRLVSLLDGTAVSPVGVFVNEKEAAIERIVKETGISYIQLHGDEPAGFGAGMGWKVIRAIAVRDRDSLRDLSQYTADYFLLDACSGDDRGGTGQSFPWDLARKLDTSAPMLLAGGLEPDNVGRAIQVVHPAGVDVSSGIETEPGIKDAARLREFVSRARAAFAEEGRMGR